MLYKYCKIDGFDILLQSRLKTSRFEDFNDPFELVFGVNSETALENIIKEFKEDIKLMKFWEGVLGDNKISFDNNFPEDVVEKVTQFQIKDFAKVARKMRKFWSEKLRVVCMSKRPDVIQMWAHYTDNHRGIEESEFPNNVPVVYRDKMVLFPITAHPENLKQYEKHFNDVMRRKESNWSYEEEVRVYVNSQKNDYCIMPASSIKEIYLGLRSQETTEIVAKSIKQRDEYKHLKIYKMDIDERAYKLVPKEL